MTREFTIIDGPSLRDLDLAFFDPVPQEMRGNSWFMREICFRLGNEPDRHLPAYQREFKGLIRAMAREGDLSHQTAVWKIEGMGGFNPGSRYFEERAKENRGNAGGSFKATFNPHTRSGTMIFPTT